MKYLLTFSFAIFSILLFGQEEVRVDSNGLQFEWEKTEVISNSVTDKNFILIKVNTNMESLNLDEFVLFINGDSINQAENKQFENTTFSVEVPLRVGVNDIYVLYQAVNTSVLRIIYKPKRYNLSLFAAGIASEPCFTKNAFDFSNLLEKQFLLYSNRNYIILDDEKVSQRKLTQGYKSLKKQYLASRTKSENDLIVTYISSSGLIENGLLRLKDRDFNARKPEKSSFTLSKLMDRMLHLECQKVLFLDIQLDKNYSEKELLLLQSKLIEMAKKDDFTLFAAIQNQTDFKLNENKNSAFTDLLIKGMNQKADENQDKIISTLELANYLKKQKVANLVLEVQSDFPIVTIE